MPNVSRARIAAAWDDAVGGGAGADWTSFMERAARIWDATREPFLESALDGAANRWSRRPAGSATCARSRRGGRCAGWAGSTCATRTSAPSSTGTPRTPARTRAGPRPPWPRCRTSSSRSAPGTCPAGCAVLLDAVHARAVECGARVRTGGRRRRGSCVDARAGSAGCGWRRRRRRRREPRGRRRRERRRRPPVPRPSVGRAERRRSPALRPGRLRRTQPSLSGFVLLLALRGRTPGLRHHTVLFPRRLRRRVRLGLRHRAAPALRTARRSRTRRSTSAPPTTRCCGRMPDTEAWFVLVNAPRHVAAAAPRTRRRAG